jgi:hypothetical protein
MVAKGRPKAAQNCQMEQEIMTFFVQLLSKSNETRLPFCVRPTAAKLRGLKGKTKGWEGKAGICGSRSLFSSCYYSSLFLVQHFINANY